MNISEMSGIEVGKVIGKLFNDVETFRILTNFLKEKTGKSNSDILDEIYNYLEVNNFDVNLENIGKYFNKFFLDNTKKELGIISSDEKVLFLIKKAKVTSTDVSALPSFKTEIIKINNETLNEYSSYFQ